MANTDFNDGTLDRSDIQKPQEGLWVRFRYANLWYLTAKEVSCHHSLTQACPTQRIHLLYSSTDILGPKSLHGTADGLIGLPITVRNPEEWAVDSCSFDPTEVCRSPERSPDGLVSMTRDVRSTQM